MGSRTDIKKRTVYLDVLNISAIIAVVFLHSTGNYHSFTMNRAWVTSCFAQCCLYWAVPVFVMCTGATLFDFSKKYSLKEYFRRRVLKVLIPFIFWSCFFIFYKVYNGSIVLSDHPVADILNAFFTNQAAPTYYFIFTIIGIYLTIPFLTPLAHPRFRGCLWYAVLVMFVTQSVLPVFFQAFGVSYNSNVSILMNGYMIYVLLGYLLSTQEIPGKYRMMIYAAAIFSILLRFIYTWKSSFAKGEIDYLFSGYVQFHAFLSAAAVFLFVKTVFSSLKLSETVKNLLCTLSGCSFGVFLLHREPLFKLQGIWDPSGQSWQFRLFGGLLIYAVTVGIVYVMKKIPVIRRLVP